MRNLESPKPSTMAMALLCRRKGFFRYQLCGRLFSSSSSSSNPSPPPIFPSAVPSSSSSSFRGFRASENCKQRSSVLETVLSSSCLRVSERRFFSTEAEAASYPTPAPPGDFEDFPDAGDDYDEDGGESEDPPPDPDEGALYSPSESEN